ncbi:MAG: amidophosphoribosyltransferase, partial [Gemmatimonadota bacterium]
MKLPILNRGPREKCGVFAVSGLEKASELAYLGLYALQHRGQESAGIAVWGEDGKMRVHRGMGIVAEVFSEETLRTLPGRVGIGHTRYSTSGDSILQNAQPVRANYREGEMALAHNGNLTNAAELKNRLVAEGAIFQGTSDTEVIVHLIARSQKPTTDEQILDALHEIEGAFSLLILLNDTVYA